MPNVKITIKGLDKAINDINDKAKGLKGKADEVTKRLAEIGLNTATIIIRSAESNGDEYGINSITDIEIKPIKDGYSVVASGREILFIEFGAGVYYNGSESYLGTRPPGIKGIGEYGQGKGKRKGWDYIYNGETKFTKGIPAKMPMYYATKDIQQSIEKVVKEVFK